jgi:HrpA-like RNA helicase
MAKKHTKEVTPAVPTASSKDSKKNGSKDKKNQQTAAPDEKPRPSSTARPTSGKTPISLLHEHAQRSKWGRVEYDMLKVKDGMTAIANLSWVDPKTKDVINVKVKHNLPAKETPIEARYFAACVALHRVSFNKNLAMVLPREFKDTWSQLEEERKALLKSDPIKHNRLYNNDPFKIVLENRKESAKREKERESRFNNDSKVKKAPVSLTSVKSTPSNSVSPSPASTLKRSFQTSISERAVKFPKKVWDSATTFNFSSREREEVHSFIKSRIHWEKLHRSDSGDSLTSPKVSKQTLLSIGFRETHVDEALTYKDPLSFLLFNVPDDDLPHYFTDSASKDLITVVDKNERVIQKITEFGISRNQAIAVLNMNKGNINDVICYLTLQNSSYPTKEFLIDESEIDETKSFELWNEEIESLSMIYEPEKITVLTNSSVEIKFTDLLSLTVYKPKLYPYEVSGLVISVIDKNQYKLPNYIKMKILQKLSDYAVENLVGDSYIYSLIDWLEQHAEQLIQNPGPLLEVSVSQQVKDLNIDGDLTDPSKERKRFKSKPDLQFIKSDYNERIKSAKYSEMLKIRQKLPAWSEQTVLLDTINSNSVSLITGETGSGKSTQLVQFVLDSLYANGDYKTQILCTQPRRISAIGLAERVAEERAGKCGDEVGYIIRGANKSNKNTKIKFLTTGILVKFLQNGDEFLNDSILVLDEVHERSMETDLIIIMIKNLLKKYKNLKIILMSATVDVSIFKNYFKGLTTAHIKGRTFPIKDYYLDEVLEKTDFKIQINGELISPKADSKFFQTGNINYDLISQLVTKIDADLTEENNPGSILVFLPGVGEINKCVKQLNKEFPKASVILPLHSALTPQEQHRVFESFKNKRKIVVSTNIAETSITINDCVVTIDSGRVKSMTYNSIENTTKLVEIFASKAEAKQRRGRAGRVQNGISYKLFTKETENSMIDTPIPEIKRVNLDSLYLVVKSMGIKDVIKFLNSGMDPPPMEALSKSDEILKCSGLIDEYDDLTELGKIISFLPIVDPKHGKLLTLSIIFGCTDIGILIASVLSSGSPFLRSFEVRDNVKALLTKTKDLGDLLSSVLVVQKYFELTNPSEKRKYMNDNYLSFTKVNEIKSSIAQFTSILDDLGFLPMKYRENENSYLNRNKRNFPVIKAIITGAFYPQVARVQLPNPKFFNTASGSVQVDPDAKLIKYWIRNEEYITQMHQDSSSDPVENEQLPANRSFIHPSSVLFDTSVKELDQSQLKELLQNEEVKRNEDGLIDFDKLQGVNIDLTPQAKKYKSNATKAQFIIYNSSTVTNKLYLRDITPTSTLSTLLFGGPISYDLSTITSGRPSPGIVLDSWLPVKTWSKNAVLIKELRVLVDNAIKEQLENPSYNQTDREYKENNVLHLIETVLNNEYR